MDFSRVNEKEKDRARIARDLYERMKSLRRPEQMMKFEEQMRTDRRAVFNALGSLSKDEGKRAADALLNFVVNSDAYSHYTGVRRGYRAAKRLAKMKTPDDNVMAQIVSVVEKHPKWSNERICGVLDDDGVPLYWPRHKLPKRAEFWIDIAKEPKVKMLLCRVRSAVRQDAAARMWSRIMQEHDRLRRSRRATDYLETILR